MKMKTWLCEVNDIEHENYGKQFFVQAEDRYSAYNEAVEKFGCECRVLKVCEE